MISCKWCGSIVETGPGPASVPEWKRWRCIKCNSLGYIAEPDADDISRVYQTAWENSDAAGDFAAGTTTEQIASSLLEVVGWRETGGRCLDYGGGKGQLACALVNNGCMNLTVYEPYNKNPGLTSVRWIHDVNELETGKYEWIFLIEVVEHFLHPLDELRIIYQALSPGGKLVITTPNASGWRAYLDRFQWREVQNSTHINLFSTISLEQCLRSVGFENINRVYNPVSYGKRGLRRFVLGLTQRLGLDGGLRFIAIKNK